MPQAFSRRTIFVCASTSAIQSGPGQIIQSQGQLGKGTFLGYERELGHDCSIIRRCVAVQILCCRCNKKFVIDSGPLDRRHGQANSSAKARSKTWRRSAKSLATCGTPPVLLPLWETSDGRKVKPAISDTSERNYPRCTLCRSNMGQACKRWSSRRVAVARKFPNPAPRSGPKTASV